MSSGITVRKKYKHLTVLQRVEIIKKLGENVSPKDLAKQYGVMVHTIYHIKKNAANFMQEVDRKYHVDKTLKKIKGPILKELDNKLYLWFVEQCAIGNVVRDQFMQKKAKELNAQIGGPSTFTCNRAWLWRFKKRHGIHLIRMACENANVVYDAAEQFSLTFEKFIQEENINICNIYNMDETGLLWKSLPQRTSVPSTIQTLREGKIEKDRITLGFCANATGSHKLLPLFIDTFRKPETIKNVKNLPVVYKSRNNTWVDRNIFRDWYENSFKPEVKAHQLKTGLSGKVLLLVDNCSAHILPPDAAKDDHFEIKYLPPNAASLIQPMDQGVIAKIKLRYKYKLAEKIQEYHGNLAQLYKEYSIKDCINIVNICWKEVTEVNIRKSWKQVLKKNYETEVQEMKVEDTDDYSEHASSITEILQNYPETAVTEKEVEDWFRFCKMEECKICDEEGNEEEEDNKYKEEEKKGNKEKEEEKEDNKIKVEIKEEEEEEKEEQEEKEKGANGNSSKFRDEDVEKALETIVQWSKQFDLSVQLHVNALKDFFDQARKNA